MELFDDFLSDPSEEKDDTPSLDDIFAEARGPKQLWTATSNVALVQQQTCTTCSHTHSFFLGWFTERLSVQDKHTRKLTAGRSPGLPAIVERQSAHAVEWCSDCVEAQIILDNALSPGK